MKLFGGKASLGKRHLSRRKYRSQPCVDLGGGESAQRPEMGGY